MLYLAGLKDGAFVVTNLEGRHDKDAQKFQKKGDVLEFEKWLEIYTLGLTLTQRDLLGHKNFEDVVKTIAPQEHLCPLWLQLAVLGIIDDFAEFLFLNYDRRGLFN